VLASLQKRLRQIYVYNKFWYSLLTLLLCASIAIKESNFISFEGGENQQCAVGKSNILKMMF